MQREGKMPKTTIIYVSANALGISAKNSAFPKVADIMALRMLRQDVCAKSDHYVKGISFERVPVLGCCPVVQL
jgi:hypothetical protein